ncbi:M15 family metallopeptidase [Ruegeria sp. 2012CJ41-6]|uniref:M15 family metallopeptidase n=1 Tax=Ruegeria spongiae TaxID=2942209 RepID=A0ABT0QA55_9RHOB|nr:M15 family metallopeptidase [Ruegeria spongiae]MCL6286048.1 M15 family metallopeptidase [Ruegeria spongiae]
MRKLKAWIPLSIMCMVHSLPAQACTPVDYLKLKLPEIDSEPEKIALKMSYPGIQFSEDGTKISHDGIDWIAYGSYRSKSPQELLRDPTIKEQFSYVYSLDFDLSQRKMPFFDPGRPRNGAFFEVTYFDNEESAQQSLVNVTEPRLAGTDFWVTEKHGVSCQLRAALSHLSFKSEDFSPFFRKPGGGFNWRRISGTKRLSPHSFGIAIDINPQLGQYWKWTGAIEGEVGPYHNKVPEALVRTMERFGFVWGGKWHHFDGMHFEYRPEIILYSRIAAR